MGCEVSNKKIKKNKHLKKLNKSIDSFTSSDTSMDDESYLKVNTNSESCIDNLDFMMKIEDNVIKVLI